MPANILRLLCEEGHLVQGVSYDPLEKGRVEMESSLDAVRRMMRPWCCVCGSDVLHVEEEVAAEPSTAAAVERLLREHAETRARRDPHFDRRPRPPKLSGRDITGGE